MVIRFKPKTEKKVRIHRIVALAKSQQHHDCFILRFSFPYRRVFLFSFCFLWKKILSQKRCPSFIHFLPRCLTIFVIVFSFVKNFSWYFLRKSVDKEMTWDGVKKCWEGNGEEWNRMADYTSHYWSADFLTQCFTCNRAVTSNMVCWNKVICY